MSRAGAVGLVREQGGDREPEAGDDRSAVEVVADLKDARGRGRVVNIHLALVRPDQPDDPNAGPDQYAPPKPAPPPVAVEPPAKAPEPAPTNLAESMPIDTGSIVAALTDTSETPAEVEAARNSEMPTMAVSHDEVEALARGAEDRHRQNTNPTPVPSADLVDADATGHDPLINTQERTALDFSDETIARPATVAVDDAGEDDVMVVDDLAEIIEEDELADEAPRSIPPPLPPRQS